MNPTLMGTGIVPQPEVTLFFFFGVGTHCITYLTSKEEAINIRFWWEGARKLGSHILKIKIGTDTFMFDLRDVTILQTKPNVQTGTASGGTNPTTG